MTQPSINISIIIPFKWSLQTLPRLFDSIPKQDNIEIILVENSDTPLTREQIGIDRDYVLLNAAENRYAGGARNVGIENAQGKWIIFADADDFFPHSAFGTFERYISSSYDLIYFGCDSVYDDNLQPSDRHKLFNGIVNDLYHQTIPEIKGKLYHVVPWAKMIRRDLILNNNIRFDEVIASNDIYFSTLCAFYSQKFGFSTDVVYTVTTRKGSLANNWNTATLKARYSVALRRNRFLKDHTLGKYQVSIMYYLFQAFKVAPNLLPNFILQALKYRQNIFIGITSWIKSYLNIKKELVKNKKYIIYNNEQNI